MPPHGDVGSNPMPSADENDAPMVKWTSCLGSNEVFRVRLLVGVLENQYVGQRVPLAERSSPMLMPRTVESVFVARQ